MDLLPRYSETAAQEVDKDDVPKFFGCGSEFKTTNGKCTIEWEPIENISRSEMRKCFISEVRDQTVPGFMTPEFLQEIHFDGFISHSNLWALVSRLSNLKLLEIHLSTLQCLDFPKGKTQARLDLPNLDSLEISSTNFTYSHALCANMESIHQNLMTIFRTPNNFPSLVYLSISIPTYPPIDEKFASSVLQFIGQHKFTLKYLNIEAEYTLLQDNNGKVFEDALYEPTPSLEGLNQIAVQEAGGVNLASFHYFSLIKSASTEIWHNFMQSQNDLEYFQFWCEEHFYPFPYDLLERNDILLHTVALNIDAFFSENLSKPSSSTPVDFQVFQGCPFLKVLFIKGNAKSLAYAAKRPTVKNVHLLPKSLEMLKIYNLLLAKQDLTFVVAGLPNLRNLSLKNVGENNHLGLRFSDLGFLIEKESIHSIELVSSMNLLSFNENAAGGGGVMNGFKLIAKLLFSKQESNTFRVCKNSEGKFDLMSDDEEFDDDDDVTLVPTDAEVCEVEELEVETEEPEKVSELSKNPSISITKNQKVKSIKKVGNESSVQFEGVQQTNSNPGEGYSVHYEGVERADSLEEDESLDYEELSNIYENKIKNQNATTKSAKPEESVEDINENENMIAESDESIDPSASAILSSAAMKYIVATEKKTKIKEISTPPPASAELVDEHEANVDMFVKDFSNETHVPS